MIVRFPASERAGRPAALTAPTTVLGSDLHRTGVGHHALAPIPREVVIHPALDRPKQRRLAVVPATDNERHARGHTESRDLAGVRCLEGNAQAIGRSQCHRISQRRVLYARASRQARAVRHKGHEAPGSELRTQCLGVVDGFVVDPQGLPFRR